MKMTAAFSGAIFLALAQTAGAQVVAEYSGSTIITLSTGPRDGDSSIFPFGVPNSMTYGEVFTAPITGTLTSFTMPTIYSPFNGYPDSGGGVGNLRGAVGTWNGPSTIGLGYGSPKTLYLSGFTPSPGAGDYTFSPDVHVVAGHEYVAFLTVYGDPFATGSAAMPTNFNTVPSIDYFVYNQTSDPFRNDSWDYALFPGLNVADFSATFTARQVLVTPEPGTWAMMLLGFAGLSFAGYRRARSRGVPARAAV